MNWDTMAENTVINWIRSDGPSGKDIVPMYYKGRWAHDCEDGMRGDIKARPVSLGPGPFTATYSPHDFEACGPNGGKIQREVAA